MFFFLFNDSSTTESYPYLHTLSLHDALPISSPLRYGMLHYGGLDNFRSVFGSDSDFFKGKPWYVGAFNGGADSAQIFEAGGYRFLHIGLEMAPEDEVVAGAEGLLRK